MFWYSLLAVLAVLFVLSVALPVPRRIWAFLLISAKYFWLWVADALFLRRLAFAITGNGAHYQKLTRPALFRMWCEDMGPTFIKFGQIIASSAGMFPDAYVKEFQKVLDRVKPFPYEEVKRTLVEELGAEKAAHLVELEPIQLASASLAQVHAATLADGTAVVVKVQVPGIEDVIEADIAALRAVAGTFGELPGIDLATLSDELARALHAELDYVAEADALRLFATGSVRVPVPIADRTTARVLTMTRIDGDKLTTALDRLDETARDRVLGALVSEVAAQVLVRGHVHADPHPGNFLVTPAGELAMLDFGCTLALSREERAAYARLVLAIARGDDAAAAHELATLGFVADDPAQLVAITRSLIGALRPGAAASELDWDAAFAAQLAQAKQLGGLVIPRSFVLLGRVLATLAGLLATYRPRLQLHALILPHLAAAAR